MSDAAADDRPCRGRPRSAALDAAIVTAAIELLGEVGMVGLSMDLLAQRAGVGKATIYRRWSSKEQLVIDVLQSSAEPIVVPDTGSVVEDLRSYTRSMAERLASGRMSDVLPHLIEASCYDEELRESLDEFALQRQSTVRELFERGVARGELGPNFDIDMAVDTVLGAFVYRRLMSGAVLDAGFADRLVAFVVPTATTGA